MRDEDKTREQLIAELQALRRRLAEAFSPQPGPGPEPDPWADERARAEREIQERRLYLEAVLASAPDAVVTLDAQHRLVDWNPGAERLFGYSREEAVGRDIDDLVTNSATFEEAVTITQRVLAGTPARPFEATRYRKDGSAVDVEVAGSPIYVDGELIGLVSIYTDIGERKRAERALRKAVRGLQMLSQCNEVLSRARDEAELLRDICQVAVEIGGYRMAWVGLADEDQARTVRPVAQAGFEEGYLGAVTVSWGETEYGRGPTGTAIRTGQVALARDIQAAPELAPWRSEATRRGYGSSIALPLQDQGQAFGALTVYASEADSFDADEAGLLAKLADNLAYGMAALRTRAQRTRVEEALHRYAERLVTLHQIDRAILEAQSAEAIAQATLARVVQMVPCRQAHISAFGSEDQRAVVLASSRSAPSTRSRRAAASEIDIPLVAQGELVGIIHLESGTTAAFSAEQIETVYEVAAPLAVAIQQARLNEQLRSYAGSLEETITQRTRELKAERDRTQAILESLGEAVIVTDLDGTILYTNPATTSLTGLGSEETLGQNWQILAPEGDHAELYARAQEAMRAGEYLRSEMVGRRKDGTLYDAAVTATPLFTPDDVGQLLGCVWVQRDITPLKEAERFKDQFVSNVSHELRTPLSIMTLIIGNLDRLYGLLDDDKRQEMIRSIREQVGLLNDLIGDILEISRIDSGRISLERQPIDLAQLVREEVDKQQPLARRKSQVLRTGGEDPLTVQGNESQLRRVVRNLLDNAIKFTPPGGSIMCDCRALDRGGDLGMEWPGGSSLPAGRWAALRVVDTGIGISREDRQGLFERFYRVKTQGNIPGTGLGLSITRELVELHGGQVAVASYPGEGSVFAVFLPLAEEEP